MPRLLSTLLLLLVSAGPLGAQASATARRSVVDELRLGGQHEAENDPGGAFTVSTDLHVCPSACRFSTLQAAMAFLNRYAIAPGAIVRILIADGVYAMPAGIQIVISHPQGAQIQIVGDIADRGAVVFNVPAANSQGFIVVLNGANLGLVDGLSIQGTGGWVSHGVWNDGRDGRPDMAPYGWAVLNSGGGHVNIGAHIAVRRFYYGLRAELGGSITAAPGVLVDEAGDVGMHAVFGGSIEASGTSVTNVSHAAVGQGSGYLAEAGSSLKADSATAAGCAKLGFGAISASNIWAENAQSYGNDIGFLAANGGHVIAESAAGHTAQAHHNRIGVYAVANGSIEFAGSSSHDNRGDGISINGPGSIDATGARSSNNGGAIAVARYNGVIYGAVVGSGNAKNTPEASLGGIVGASPAP